MKGWAVPGEPGTAHPDSGKAPYDAGGLPSGDVRAIAPPPDGSVAEWSKAHAWKVCRG